MIHIKLQGTTEDGKPVAAGLFKLFDSQGIPLDVLFVTCQENGIVPDWIAFCEEVYQQGWTDKALIRRLDPVLADIYGPEYRDVVMGRLKLIYGWK
jgi:hypothetical protein